MRALFDEDQRTCFLRPALSLKRLSYKFTGVG